MLRFIDGFDHYNQSQIPMKWTSRYDGTNPNIVNFPTYPTRFAGTGSMFFVNGTVWVRKILDSQSTWITGIAVYINGLLGNIMDLFSWEDIQANGTTSTQHRLILTATNQLRMYANGSPDVTSTYALPQNTWQYIEFKVTIHNTTGSFEVKANGNTVLGPTTNVNTRNGGSGNNSANQLRIGSNSGSTPYILFDDLYIADGTGSLNNTFIGESRVLTELPLSTGTYNQWSQVGGSSGGPYSAVNEPVHDSDASYIYSPTLNNKTTFLLPPVTSNILNIAGVQTNIVARKDDAGQRKVTTLVRRSTTDAMAPNPVSLSDSYYDYTQIMELNPATSAAWTVANITDTEYGVQVQ